MTVVGKYLIVLFVVHRFGHKENYMTFMNSFIESESANMKKFLHLISVNFRNFVPYR